MYTYFNSNVIVDVGGGTNVVVVVVADVVVVVAAVGRFKPEFLCYS